MGAIPEGWLTAIAPTAVSATLGASIVVVDEPMLAPDLTGAPVVLLGGLLTVFAALAASDESPLTDE
jgi:hypothetical protein